MITADLVIRNGKVVSPESVIDASVAIKDGVVISVGGFFDIRHKDVAVTFKSLIIMRNRTADAIDHVTLAASKRDLLQAAAFQPLSQQRAELEAKR